MLAFIDPGSDLPFARYELLALERLLPDGKLRAFEGEDAETDRFFEHANACTHLHFACHGRQHWSRPLETGIKLADAGLGALSFLQDVDLSGTKLATLSACETGITTVFRQLHGNTMTFGGEEYMGLAGALHAAGVEYVISTLWPVEDYVATLFIEAFYEFHLGRGMDCPSALAGARDELRQYTAEKATQDIRCRLQADCGELLMHYLEGIEALLTSEYQPEDRPFDNLYCWAPYVLSGRPMPVRAT